MTGNKTKSSRRAFFVSGGAVLGAGVASTVGAAALAPAASPVSAEEQLSQLRQQLSGLEDREAIRQLHLAFTALVEQKAYEAAVELFDEQAQLRLSGASASGKPAIRRLFANEYRNEAGTAIHSAYRQNASKQMDAVSVAESGLHAVSTFHVDVELCTPLQADCTAAEMARLQGHVADRRWESGKLEAKYVKTRGEWRIASLSYLAA